MNQANLQRKTSHMGCPRVVKDLITVIAHVPWRKADEIKVSSDGHELLIEASYAGHVSKATYEVKKLVKDIVKYRDPDVLDVVRILLDKMDENSLLLLVRKNYRFIEFIDSPSEPICVEAVTQHGCAIKYIRNQTPLVCKLAVSNKLISFKHVMDKTEDLCRYVVGKDGLYIRFISNPSKEIKEIAVKQNPDAMAVINKRHKRRKKVRINKSDSYVVGKAWYAQGKY